MTSKLKPRKFNVSCPSTLQTMNNAAPVPDASTLNDLLAAGALSMLLSIQLQQRRITIKTLARIQAYCCYRFIMYGNCSLMPQIQLLLKLLMSEMSSRRDLEII